ncbi:MAG TPA: thioredoxin family protein [Thermoanaerobaculia bacterium]|jgi:thiol:disulfide interchange protein
MDRTEPLPHPDSQSRLSPVLLWVLIAAVLFRVVTAVMDGKGNEPEGLVRWQEREKAGSLSRTTGKPILYDFTAAWCAPCHLLDRDWNDSAIAEKVNASFVPARVVDRRREDGKNPREVDELLQRYEITGFPTLVVASTDGRLIGKLEGYSGRDALVQFLDESGRK